MQMPPIDGACGGAIGLNLYPPGDGRKWLFAHRQAPRDGSDQLKLHLSELCSFGFVANQSPSAAGLAIRHSQQLDMIKSLAALAMLLGTSVLVLPGFR